MESTDGLVESVVGVIFSKNRQECPEPVKAEVQGKGPLNPLSSIYCFCTRDEYM